jgi:hypothetical protein
LSRVTAKFLPLAFLTSALIACGEAIPAHRNVRLPSGRSVKVLEISDVELAGGLVGLHLDYETEVALEDPAALYREVEALWGELRFVEQVAGKSQVVIQALTPEERGWSRERRGIAYTLQLDVEGGWQFVNSRNPEAKL